MNIKEVRENARKVLNGYCKVCRNCDGVACAGEIPGIGGKGTGSSFKANYTSLANIKLNMRTLYKGKTPNSKAVIFGKEMDMPVFAAPVTGVSINNGKVFKGDEYIKWIVEGCLNKRIYPTIGDTPKEEFLLSNLNKLKKYGGEGIAFIKPWDNENIIKKIKLVEEAGCFAVGVDVDACGLRTIALHVNSVSPKSTDDLKEIIKSTKLPFIIKGVMTVDEAKLAVEVGASGIVVSNHGGRVLDFTPGTADVLKLIADEVKGKITIFVDGGVRTGVDVLKMISLGADAVFIGRPFIVASFGGETEGVKTYIQQIKEELLSTMTLTGCNSIKDINHSIISR
ncbi:alpha-hydroxy-acid oxidizing protein [Abyssisolibacter fermentans]|uniref:alpha-hydroxy-acid oxidizing protein n=1 Tax=Abyssisolibacter fermentans TaxID=1766203 RepID=UPI00082EE3B4|nr:alpha-hydroxy-acid oxidizing protein [Abyssisolibacter fermentans]